MGYIQAAGLAAALCVQKGEEPRQLDVKELQRELIAMGASPYRAQERKRREEVYARERVREFVARRGELITPGEILRQLIVES